MPRTRPLLSRPENAAAAAAKDDLLILRTGRERLYKLRARRHTHYSVYCYSYEIWDRSFAALSPGIEVRCSFFIGASLSLSVEPQKQNYWSDVAFFYCLLLFLSHSVYCISVFFPSFFPLTPNCKEKLRGKSFFTSKLNNVSTVNYEPLMQKSAIRSWWSLQRLRISCMWCCIRVQWNLAITNLEITICLESAIGSLMML